MKILQLIKYFEPSQGGMESVAKNLLFGMEDNNDAKYEKTVLCNNHIKSTKRIIEKISDITVIRFRSFFLKSQPISIRFKGLKNEIKKADIIHHHYPYPTMEIALLRHQKLLNGKKFIITWHANIQNSRWAWIERMYNPIIKKLLNKASYIVVTSPQILEFSTILKSFSNKVVVIPLSFNLPQCNQILPKELSARPKILFVGKLRKYKGLIYLIDSIKNINVELNIIGNGEEDRNISELIIENKLNNRVFIHRNVDNDELIEFYKTSDIFVLPSINEAEAFGVVQLEALSFGLPVINTYLKSGVPFVSLNNISGLTVNPMNSEELTIAINKLINNPELYHTFSKNALERVCLFSNERMVNSYLNLYNSEQ